MVLSKLAGPGGSNALTLTASLMQGQATVGCVGVGLAICAIGVVPGLINSIYQALGTSEPANKNSPLAYAAYAPYELLR
jgi:hypothetical protein